MPTAGDRLHDPSVPTTRPATTQLELQHHLWIWPREEGDQIREAALQFNARGGAPPSRRSRHRRPGFGSHAQHLDDQLPWQHDDDSDRQERI